MGNYIGTTILFPAPPVSYDSDFPNLIWIDEDLASDDYIPDRGSSFSTQIQCFRNTCCSSPDVVKKRIPALFFKATEPTKHTILYWHGNSCDLGHIHEELEVLCSWLSVNICALEFPGYGLRRDVATSAELIDEWSRAAFNYLRSLGIHPESITCFGRSIGTGPACKLASTLKSEGINVAGVVLHAAYVSINTIVNDYSSIGTWFIPNFWDNSEELVYLSDNDTPLLVIHGGADEVIPQYHGHSLFENYESKTKYGWFPEDSSHNAYYIVDDIARPLKHYLEKFSRSRDAVPITLTLVKSLKGPSQFCQMHDSLDEDISNVKEKAVSEKHSENDDGRGTYLTACSTEIFSDKVVQSCTDSEVLEQNDCVE